ncbi:MAG: radical SAM family heme chaperone HemW [Chloroflexi bacterium]|nr:radical SAM family heme chaperone HemW [Chloroflexota bacterium]
MQATPSHAKPSPSPATSAALALYLHIPFCHVRCTYCAFNIYTKQERLIAPYMAALRHEIALASADATRPALSIYFGGGTPSLVPAAEIAATLDTIRHRFALDDAAEITLELNPESAAPDTLYALRRAGVNRLSIGMQSAHAEELKLYARLHTLDDVRQAVRYARAAGFDNISLDLIYGAPRQTLAMWQDSLHAALALAPEHISFYSLTIEDGTTFDRWTHSGRIPEPDPDLAADMYEWATDELATAGYEQYEISNWALPGRASRHNLQYWRCEPYLGLGAGAHGYANSIRTQTVLRPDEYITRIENQRDPRSFPLTGATTEAETIDRDTAMAEQMIMGLRLVQEGVHPEAFTARFGVSLETAFGSALAPLREAGLLTTGPQGQLRLTRRGRLLGNQVFMAFI